MNPGRPSESSLPEAFLRGPGFTRAVLIVWSLACAGVLLRAGIIGHHHSVIHTYTAAGRHWLAGEPLYEGTQGFVYSPLIGALFAAFALPPETSAAVLWIAFCLAAYAGVRRLGNSGAPLFCSHSRGWRSDLPASPSAFAGELRQWPG